MVRFQTLGTIDLRAADGAELRAILSLNKRLGLLAYLTLATPRGFHRRDTLIALFWPDFDTGRARAALSRAVYDIRIAAGADILISRGDEELGVDWTKIQCDALLFEDMVTARDSRAAIDVYRGDLLPGFFLSEGSADFDYWLDERREDLRRRAAEAAWRATEGEETAGRGETAAAYARRYMALRNGDETALRKVMSLLDRLGDKASAAAIYREFAERASAEFGIEPSPETRHLLARIRERGPEASPVAVMPPAPMLSIEAPSTSRRRLPLAVMAGFATLVIAGTAALLLAAARDEASVTIAVGDIASTMAGDSVRSFAALLTTNLARIESMDVVSERRLNQLRTTSTALIDAEAAARMAGADEYIEGTLTRSNAQTVRLDIRRIDLRSGAIREAYSIHAKDFYDLVDLAVEHIANDLEVGMPADRRGASTGSLVAYALYEEGLRAYYRADRKAAEHLFKSALEADSAFAMASFFTALAIGGHGMDDYLARAVRLSENTNERERLLIKATWGAHMQDPRAGIVAESLVVRHPDDLDGRLILARTLRAEGRRRESITHFQHVIRLDSANINKVARCYACDAFAGLAGVYAAMDSADAAERTAREWLRYQPREVYALATLSGVLERAGRFAENAAVLDSIARYSGTAFPGNYTSVYYRTGNFDAADRAWREMKNTTQPDSRETGLWDEFISSRAQGRLKQAHAAGREFRHARAQHLNDPRFIINEALLEGHALHALGKYREAAALYDSIARVYTAPIASRVASHRVTQWTFVATSLARAGDTAALGRIETAIRMAGSTSLIAAHRRRHFYVRGLREEAQGNYLDAARDFERALIPDDDNLALIYMALARSYMAAGQSRDAIAPLVAASRGPISAAGLSVSQTDVQEMLGQAYDASRQPDSAIIQYTRVLHAWRRADPELGPRRAAVRARLAALATSRTIRP